MTRIELQCLQRIEVVFVRIKILIDFESLSQGDCKISLSLYGIRSDDLVEESFARYSIVRLDLEIASKAEQSKDPVSFIGASTRTMVFDCFG